MGKYTEILDPLWITKKDYIDSEYYNYILLDAEKKYMANLEVGSVDRFYEIMFHFLNLNNLVLDGNLFDFKMNPYWKDPKIKKIKRELHEFYGDANESGETVKIAHGIFSGILLNYLEYQVESFERHSNLFYVNPQLHIEDNIFVVMNRVGFPTYDIWRFRIDKRCYMSQRFEKVTTLEMDNPKENELRDVVNGMNDPILNKMEAAKNVCFCSLQDDEFTLDKMSSIVRNIIAVNKVMINAPVFDPNVLANAHMTLHSEALLPFKLTR